jgi:hypothetical protein
MTSRVFTLQARYDLFNNSNLLNPSESFTGQGLGFWQIKKSIGNLGTNSRGLFTTNLVQVLFLELLKTD